MKNVCVVTGGGSGMGFDAAKILGKDHKIILVGRTVSKLEGAVNQLKAEGIDASAFPADISNRDSVKALTAHAKEQGNIKTVIHAAGISPMMGEGEKVFVINALGTIYINEEFGAVMNGGCILNVSSMAAHMLPEGQTPKQVYQLSLKDPEAFKQAMLQVLSSVPDENKSSSAYVMSKNFVNWFTVKMALKYGKNGVRAVSISPGTFKTPMGLLEGEAAAAFAINGPLGRVGEPEEIARMMAFMVSDECSYLTAADILYDGGAIAAMRASMENQQ